MKVKWLTKALKNLDQEAEYIARDNPVAATHMANKIIHAVQQLSSHPSLGRAGRIHGTRELIIDHTPYIIPYRIHQQSVEILRVFHTSRRLQSQW